MDNNMKQTFLFLFSFLLLYSSGLAKTPDSIYTFTAYGGIGYVRDIAEFNYEFPSLNRGGFLAGLRVMWKPDYLLRAGIEVGRTDLYSIDEPSISTDSGTTNLKTDVYAWNFMLVFSMSPIKNLEINAGTGVAFNTVNNSAFGNESTSTDGGSVFMISSGYYTEVSKNLRVGAELRWTHIPKYDDQTISLQLSLAYTFLEY
jgi:hypothetical protein